MVDQESGATQIGLSAGEPMSDDQVVEHNGETLLHILPSISLCACVRYVSIPKHLAHP